MWRQLKGFVRPFEISDAEDSLISHRISNLANNKPTEPVTESLLGFVETKSGTMLTHISMMISVTSVLFVIADKSFAYQVLLAGELIAYLVLAVLCLRCQYQFDVKDYQRLPNFTLSQMSSPQRSEYVKILRAELFFRENLFRFVLKSLYLLTILLIFTVVLAIANDEIVGALSKVGDALNELKKGDD